MSVAMEDSAAQDQSSAAAKDPSSAAGRSTARLLRYPLRSASRPKEEKPTLADSSNSNSAPKRGKLFSSVSKSVNLLDLSGKDKPAKPPRRLSVPSKPNGTPAPKSVGNSTPVSDARAKRSAVNQGKSDTPVSDVSKSLARKKFSVITSASYWSSQIKLSESAARHSISLGFFKLALEAGCEPIHRMSDELKSYVRRHDLIELGETVKELFEAYKIPDNFELSGSQVPPEGYQLSDDDVKSSSSSVTDAEKVKPKKPSVIVNADETQKVKKVNSETSEKDNDSVKMMTRKSVPKRAVASPNNKSGSELKGCSVQKKPQKLVKQESGQDKDRQVKKSVKKTASEEGLLNSSPPEENYEEDKENVVISEMVEVDSSEV